MWHFADNGQRQQIIHPYYSISWKISRFPDASRFPGYCSLLSWLNSELFFARYHTAVPSLLK